MLTFTVAKAPHEGLYGSQSGRFIRTVAEHVRKRPLNRLVRRRERGGRRFGSHFN
jgi:hypothetical protein